MKNRYFIGLLIGFITGGWLIFSHIGKTYDDQTTHPGLTDEMVDFYNLSFADQLSGEEKEWLVAGSIDEDTPPRWINHFYDPISGEGWLAENLGKVPPETLRFFSRVFLNLNTEIVSSKNWAHNETLQLKYSSYGGNNTWENAIREYADGNKKEAYYILGHIMHLLEDKTVPDHTRNDTHAPEGSFLSSDGGSPYEDYGLNFTRDNLKTSDDLKKANKQPVVLSSIDQYFDNLANYSNKYFFSEHTINLPKYANPKILRQVGDYGYGRDLNGSEFPLVEINMSSNPKTGDKIMEYSLRENYVLENYFSRLSEVAVLNGAGAIKLFREEAEKAKNNKNLIAAEPKISWWQKMRSPFFGSVLLYNNTKLAWQNFLTESFTQVAETTGNFVSQAYDSLKNPITASELLGAKPTGAALTAPPKPEPREKVVVLGLESGELPPAPTTPEQNKIVVEPVDLNQADSEIIPSPLPTTELIVKPKSTFIFVAGDSTPPDTFIAASVPAVTGTTTAGFVFSSSEAGDRFQYNFDNSGWLDSGFNLNLANISEGNHILEARAIDNSNNIDPTPATAEWTVDTSAPQITIAAGPGQFASSSEANFLFHADEDNIIYQCKLDDNDWQACGASTTLENLIEGEHVLMVEVSDLAGNVGSSSRDWLTDLTPPLAAITPLENQYQATGFIVGWSGDDLSASTTEASGVASFYLEYKIGSSDWFDWPIGTTSTSTVFNLSVAAGEDISFRVRAADQAGNLGQWSAPAETTIKPPLPKHLVISEFATRGPAGAYDEFVELYNPTDSAVSLLGWRIESKAASGTNWINRVGDAYLPDDLILARGYYLIYPATYSVLIGPNFMHPHNWGLADSGGHIRLVNNLGQEVDKVGYGSAIDPETAAADFDLSQGGSLERKAVSSSTAETMAAGGVHSFLGNGYDADNNADDFIWRPQREPQNSLSREPDLLNQNFCAQPLPYFNASLNIRKAIARKDTDPATPDENILVLDFPYATDRGFIMSVHDSSCDLTAVSSIGSAEPASRLIIELGYNQQTNLFNGHFRLCTDNWGNVNKIQGDRCQDGPWWSSNRWFGSNELLGQTEVIIFNNSQYTPWIRVEN